MNFEVICPHCETRLKIAQEHADRNISCPKCQNVFLADKSHSQGPASSSSIPPLGRDEKWRVRLGHGTEYGPISKSELDNWVNQGRVGADDFLKKEGQTLWKPATEIFPTLSRASTGTFETTNPNIGSTGPLKEHRGTLILVFGILGLIMCGLFGPVAWIMANTDLEEMRNGTMDPEGKEMTDVGRILGIVVSVLMGLGLLLFLAWVFFFVFLVALL